MCVWVDGWCLHCGYIHTHTHIHTTLTRVSTKLTNQVVNGSMSVGDFVAVNAYVAQAFTPLNFLGSVYTAVIKVRVFFWCVSICTYTYISTWNWHHTRTGHPPPSPIHTNQHHDKHTQALVDMQNLNQLLLESPDVVDAPNALALPPAASAAHAKGTLICVCMCVCMVSVPGSGNVGITPPPQSTIHHTG